jgi:hypothetical protein
MVLFSASIKSPQVQSCQKINLLFFAAVGKEELLLAKGRDLKG